MPVVLESHLRRFSPLPGFMGSEGRLGMCNTPTASSFSPLPGFMGSEGWSVGIYRGVLNWFQSPSGVYGV